ncbi:glycerol-3-phosphate dehydrogenase/oxidase [Tsukamurella sp. 8F]|uniref:glycerol-3-phosphate dehydrogenase/oxidase n=1 Tax=unclassified Tsukamurella TaxID=2633480 RepID=UPI0023B8D45F|nr:MULTISPECIES: glycerol-3-phosphate dehydrogenase/oxidase [unclassified Tsukamurella]MDF0529159.1 glycerol-3-phosphate dehydrogenase/oxidase [Tsukamurella sp. 8J]MDF0585344.1 glycerol-3-phosphate dehydrogenase/oxidase [Tsukamurella sp. 8F]
MSLHPAVSPGSVLSAARRVADLTALQADPSVDLLVVGGGVTGAGVALDAASRGLSVVLAERRDLAFGTSRWSSKLVHGGLRYLASGAVGIAYESAVERDSLIRTIAPHLVRPLPQVVPLLPGMRPLDTALTRIGFHAGDALRIAARTPATTLARSRRIDAAQTAGLAPTVRREGLRGGLLNWDGQLTDDARLVIGIARTAADFGARVLTHCPASEVTGDGGLLTDSETGAAVRVRARAVVNATGVWAGTVDGSVALRPSRGTHLVCGASAFAADGVPLTASLTVPVPGSFGRYVFALPQPDGRVYVGLTDEEAPGPVPDVPIAADNEIDFLLDTINGALRSPLSRDDVLGTYSGLRPLLDSGAGRTADVSRKHAVLTRADGLVTVVGGKLTTYRRMAEDAVDAALARSRLRAGACRTREIPLVGAASPRALAMLDAPDRLVQKYGTEAEAVAALWDADARLAAPVAEGTAVTGAELVFGAAVEGALDVSDLLERRTRLSLTPVVAGHARAAAERALRRQ